MRNFYNYLTGVYFQAKLREVDEAENEAADRLKNSYKKEVARMFPSSYSSKQGTLC